MPTIKVKKVTSIDDLKKYNDGAVVELPPFAEGQPFVVKMKRPSLMRLATNGTIPNALMDSATSLFEGDTNVKDKFVLSNMLRVMEIVCESAFVSPSWEEIKSSGIELTDDQLIAAFNYTQNGIKALDSFRTE